MKTSRRTNYNNLKLGGCGRRSIHEAFGSFFLGGQIGRPGLEKILSRFTARLYGKSDVVTARTVRCGHRELVRITGRSVKGRFVWVSSVAPKKKIQTKDTNKTKERCTRRSLWPRNGVSTNAMPVVLKMLMRSEESQPARN